LYCNGLTYGENELCYYHNKIKSGLIESEERLAPLIKRSKEEQESLDKLFDRASNQAVTIWKQCGGKYNTRVNLADLKQAGFETVLSYFDTDVEDKLNYIFLYVKKAILKELEFQLSYLPKPNKSKYFNYLLYNKGTVKGILEKSFQENEDVDCLMHECFDEEWGEEVVEQVCRYIPEFMCWEEEESYVHLDSDVNIHDTIEIGATKTPLDLLMEREEHKKLTQVITSLLDSVDLIDKIIIEKRILADIPLTQEEIAYRFNISQPAVVKREQKIMENIKELMLTDE